MGIRKRGLLFVVTIMMAAALFCGLNGAVLAQSNSGNNGNSGGGTTGGGAVGGGNLWTTSGNPGTDPAQEFLGTTDAVDLVIKTNSEEKLRVTSDGNVGIGTTSAPEEKLDVNGSIKVDSVNEIDTVDGDTKVLVHDSDNVIRYKSVSTLALQGPVGAAGSDGEQGPAGEDGAQGIQGPQGLQGAQGIQGTIGPQGVEGQVGANGAVGPQGPAGESTPSGFSIFGTTETAPPGYTYTGLTFAVNDNNAGPEIDQWAIMAPMAIGRQAHKSVVVNNKIYVIGGYYYEGTSSYLYDTQEYDPATNSWTILASMPTERIYPGVSVVDNKIYVVGGYTTFDDSSNNIYKRDSVTVNEEFDPATATWTTKSPMPTNRYYFPISVVGNKIYAIGGIFYHYLSDSSGGYSNRIYEYENYRVTANEVYNPATNTWETKTPMPTANLYQVASVVNNRIYHIGGHDEDSNAVLTTNREYNPATDSWATKVPMPTARMDQGVCVVNNKIYHIGGRTWDMSTGISSTPNATEVYDPANNTWAIKTPMLTARTSHTVSVMNNKIYAIGGYYSYYDNNDASAQVYYHVDANEEFNPATGSWTTKSSMSAPRANHTASVVNNKIYAIGGYSYDGTTSYYLGTNEEYSTSGSNENVTMYLHRKD